MSPNELDLGGSGAALPPLNDCGAWASSPSPKLSTALRKSESPSSSSLIAAGTSRRVALKVDVDGDAAVLGRIGRERVADWCEEELVLLPWPRLEVFVSNAWESDEKAP